MYNLIFRVYARMEANGKGGTKAYDNLWYNIDEYLLPLLVHYEDLEFYTGESKDPNGMILVVNYEQDGAGEKVPFFAVFIEGLEEEERA